MNLDRFIGLVSDPRHILRSSLRRWPSATFEQRLAWDALDRPHYAYGVWWAARTARALDLDAITVVEMGVAGGNGLVTLEAHAMEVSRLTGVTIDVVGFDAGGGMPVPAGVRDLPYVWQPGMFAMDVAALERRLRIAKVVIGDVADTVRSFVATGAHAPIGFVSFDLDYCSSTVAAFGLFDGPSPQRLPRVICYLDDVVGDDWELHSPFAGELLAVEEFNLAHDDLKIAPINGLRHKRRLPAPWNDQMYAAHDFSHPLYARPVHPAGWDLDLRS